MTDRDKNKWLTGAYMSGYKRHSKAWTQGEIDYLMIWVSQQRYSWDRIAMLINNKYRNNRTGESCRKRYRMAKKMGIDNIIITYDNAPAVAITRCIKCKNKSSKS